MDLELAIIGYLRLSGPPRVHLKRLSNFGSSDWKRALAWLDGSGLALPFWRRIEEQGAEASLPSELSAALRCSLRDHRRRIAAMAEDIDCINGAFDGAGIEYALLKGFALIPDYCPLASLRTTYDYDYLVSPQRFQQAGRRLEAIGYRRQPGEPGQPAVYFHHERPPRSPLGREDLYSADFPCTVELHSTLWNPDELKIRLDLPDDWLARRQVRALTVDQLDMEASEWIGSRLRFSALCEEHELLFQLLHAFRHLLQDWCRLASMLDIAWFVEHRSGDAAFWQRFLDQVRPRRALCEISGLVLAISAHLFGATLPRGVASETTGRLSAPVALWVRRYGCRSALDNFSSNKFSLLLHREFVPDSATWRTIQRHRLLPFHQPNRAARTLSRHLGARLVAKWNQGVYVSRRLRHHVFGGVRYGLEWLKWRQMRAAATRR